MELKAGIPILEKYQPLKKVDYGTEEIDFIEEAVTKYEVELDLEQTVLLLKYKETLVEYANSMLRVLTGSKTINDINFIEIRTPKTINSKEDRYNLFFDLHKIIRTVRTVEDILNFNQSEKINFKSLDIGIINFLIEETIDIKTDFEEVFNETEIKESYLESITSELVSYFNDVGTLKENEEKPITSKEYPTLEEILVRYEDLTVYEVVLSLLEELKNSFKEEPIVIENMNKIKELPSVKAAKVEVES